MNSVVLVAQGTSLGLNPLQVVAKAKDLLLLYLSVLSEGDQLTLVSVLLPLNNDELVGLLRVF